MYKCTQICFTISHKRKLHRSKDCEIKMFRWIIWTSPVVPASKSNKVGGIVKRAEQLLENSINPRTQFVDFHIPSRSGSFLSLPIYFPAARNLLPHRFPVALVLRKGTRSVPFAALLSHHWSCRLAPASPLILNVLFRRVSALFAAGFSTDYRQLLLSSLIPPNPLNRGAHLPPDLRLPSLA